MKKFFTLSIIAAFSLYAQTFHVSTVSQFRQALMDAATDGENDTIVLAPGVYKTDGDGGGTFKYYSTQDNNLTIIGSDDNKTILSGDNKDQILNYKTTKNTTLTLKNLVFINGNNTNDDDGGAVYVSNNIIVKDCNFTNNTAGNYGGGGGFDAGSATVTNSTFTNNTAGMGGGGFDAGSATVTNSIFTHNISESGGGGFDAGSATVTNSTFTNNISESGGGGFDAGSATVTNSTFTNNTASYDGGGFETEYGGATVTNSTFTNNTADLGGGGFKSAGSATVTNSIFTNNNGGGFWSNESATVTNSTFTNNNGGGFGSKSATVINSLFISNSQGIYSDGWGSNKIYIYNSIFKDNNVSDVDSDLDVVVYLNNNYIDLAKLSKSNVNVIAKNNIFKNVNLGFKDPKDGNYELTASSDLIDKGTTQGIEKLIPKTDLAGNPRIVGKTIDIGPYEYQGNSNQSAETNTSNIVNETDIKVGAGWNMIDIPTDISNISNIDAISVWKWNSDWKTWQAYSKDPNLENKLSLYCKIIDTLKAGDGVWVDEDKAKTLKFDNPVDVKIDWNSLDKGWNLKGTEEDINLTTIPSKVKMVWYWDNPNKKWMVYSNDANISKLLKPYYSKGTFEKINKLEANKAYWFFVE